MILAEQKFCAPLLQPTWAMNCGFVQCVHAVWPTSLLVTKQLSVIRHGTVLVHDWSWSSHFISVFNL